MARIVPMMALLAATLLAMPAMAQAQAPAGSEGDQVLVSYEGLRDAITRGNGTATAEAVTDETIVLFGKLRDMAVKSTRAQLEAAPPWQRFLVLRARQKFGRSIVGLDGKGFLSACAANGMVGDSLPAPPSRADIVIKATRATAVIRGPEGKPTKNQLAFAKQRNKWRVDLGGIMALADDEIRQGAREDKMSENQMIEQLLGLFSSTGKFDPGFWEPIDPKAANAPAVKQDAPKADAPKTDAAKPTQGGVKAPPPPPPPPPSGSPAIIVPQR